MSDFLKETGKAVLRMQGLRRQENGKFERFFSLVQETAKKQHCVFFLDCGEGRDFLTQTMEGEDLSGWLIPQNSVQEFERQFRADHIDEKWFAFFTFAIWHETPDGIGIEFKIFD